MEILKYVLRTELVGYENLDVPQWKCIHEKRRKWKIKYLTFQHKTLEMNTISSEKVEKVRAKIKDPESKYKINRNNKTRSWFFEKTNNNKTIL